METENKGLVSKKLYISTIVVLLLINSVTLYYLFSDHKEKNDLTVQQTSLQTNFKSLSDTLDLKNTEIEQFKGKNAELDKTIAAKQEEIAKEKRQIQSLFAKNKMTDGELVKARDLIAQYQANISEMGTKINELTAQNEQLMASNQRLTTDLTSEKQTTSQLSEQNKGLTKKVEVGSMLQISKLDVEAIKHRGNGKEVPVSRAKAAESLKISFETGENKVIEPGTKVSLYVRIINPKGETIAVADQGSGTIPSAESAEPVQFSKQADIDWNQTNKKVVVYWSQNIKDPGIYKVQVYQSGRVVGQGEVKLG